jgi:hypothetical protein
VQNKRIVDRDDDWESVGLIFIKQQAKLGLRGNPKEFRHPCNPGEKWVVICVSAVL